MSANTAEDEKIWSIGHSNTDYSTFAALVHVHEIETIADIRSQPYSRYTPHFNQETLQALLKGSEIQYVFMGDSLGGRPPEPEMYDADGHVLYNLLAKNFRFLQGLESLCIQAQRSKLAMMCSEESPEHCHRRLLIGRVLRDQGIDIFHIHGNGRISTDSVLQNLLGPHRVETLFGIEEEPWRSTRPVLQNGPPNNSSGR